jgi:hypothetical protein
MFYAYCWVGGEIGFGSDVPQGSILLAHGRERLVRKNIEATARLHYDGKTLLVPGVPEAKTYDDAHQAVEKHLSWLRLREQANFRLVAGVKVHGSHTWEFKPAEVTG